LGHIDNFNLDRCFRTRIDAGRLQTVFETAFAHVALSDDATLGIELRYRIGTVPDTVLTADAGVGGVHDNAGNGILFVGVDRATLEAIGVETVITSHGKIMPLGIGVAAAFEFTDAAPHDVGGITVLFVASDFAGAAANAFGHVEVKAILFAFLKLAVRDQRRKIELCGDVTWDFVNHKRAADDKAGFSQAHESGALSISCAIVKR
jgi:hypothetical protein